MIDCIRLYTADYLPWARFFNSLISNPWVFFLANLTPLGESVWADDRAM